MAQKAYPLLPSCASRLVNYVSLVVSNAYIDSMIGEEVKIVAKVRDPLRFLEVG